MLIQEVSRHTGLTKKAIVYYTEQGLVTPAVLENGYRSYSTQEVATLEKIRVLRRLDLGVDEIKAILADRTPSALHAAGLRKELAHQQAAEKQRLLEKLGHGCSYPDIEAELQTLEQSRSILERLLDAFPGCYGRFICLHFARFLHEPITTEEQRTAYEQILAFWDGAPAFELPAELEEYLSEGTAHLGTAQMNEMMEQTRHSIEHPEVFLEENREVLEAYLAYKQSEEYRSSPAFRLMECMKQLHQTSGYNDVFLPAMKRLSSSYAQYARQLEAANEKLLERYPESAV